MIRPYYVAQCYHAQIEGMAFVNLRIGYTALGLAFWPPKTRREHRWYHRLLPVFSLTLGTHYSQNDMRWLFQLAVFGRWLGYLRPGPLTDMGLHSALSLGWQKHK